MEHFTIDEAAKALDLKADFLLKTILFSGKAHPILKPCVFISEPTSMRIVNPGVNNTYRRERQESAPTMCIDVEHTMKKVQIDTPDSFAPHSFEYPTAKMQGLFELTLHPEYMDMSKVKESGRIQLYREKAAFSHLTNSAVEFIMNNRHAAMSWKAKAQMKEEVGDMVILTQGNLHYLVETMVSIHLSDIRITDRMITEYAASEGIALPKERAKTLRPKDQTVKQADNVFCLNEVLPIRFIEFYTGGKLGPETTSLLFAHKQGIDWNRQMEAEDKLTAYHWQHGKIIPLKLTEWESILYSIKSLSARYDKTDRHFDEWRTAALQLLPVAFVRRSEFDAAYIRAMSPDRITFLDQSKEFKRLTGDKDKEAREPNDTPYIPPELMSVVFEGFARNTATTNHFTTAVVQVVPQPTVEVPVRVSEDKSQPFDLLAYVKQRKTERQSDEQICYDLMVNCGQSRKYSKPNSVRLSALAIGIAVFPNQTHGSPKEKDALERHVWRKIDSYHKKSLDD